MKDGRTPDDKDGNEELEREQEAPSSQRMTGARMTSDRQAAANRARRELDSQQSGEWVATRRFSHDDELEDTWPNAPPRHFDH